MPRESIALDSISPEGRHYTGVLHYDLTTLDGSASIRVFIEEVPFKRYRYMDTLHHGTQVFVDVTGGCDGDVGIVSDGRDRRVVWRYSTGHEHSHLRLKVGTGNLEYLRVSREWQGDSSYGLVEFSYNNRGLRADCSYTANGQIIATSDQHLVCYDSEERLVFEQLGYGDKNRYATWYEYDADSRVVRGAAVVPYVSASPCPSTVPPVVGWTDFAYDEADRVVLLEYPVSIFSIPACSEPYSFSGLDSWYWHYDSEGRLDSTSRVWTDTSDMLPKYSIENRYVYGTSPKFDTSYTTRSGHDAPGTCWGSDRCFLLKEAFGYDDFGNIVWTEEWQKACDDSSGYVYQGKTTCWDYEREYDSCGRLTAYYHGGCTAEPTCDWRRTYDAFGRLALETRWSAIGAVVTTHEYALIDLTGQPPLIEGQFISPPPELSVVPVDPGVADIARTALAPGTGDSAHAPCASGSPCYALSSYFDLDPSSSAHGSRPLERAQSSLRVDARTVGTTTRIAIAGLPPSLHEPVTMMDLSGRRVRLSFTRTSSESAEVLVQTLGSGVYVIRVQDRSTAIAVK
ncbi:MAG: hypothetical protein GF331_19740 [Chitinivibrionales bacterium]|nr:hypothetical protein [Chitinivibrionales bacterium]